MGVMVYPYPLLWVYIINRTTDTTLVQNCSELLGLKPQTLSRQPQPLGVHIPRAHGRSALGTSGATPGHVAELKSHAVPQHDLETV